MLIFDKEKQPEKSDHMIARKEVFNTMLIVGRAPPRCSRIFLIVRELRSLVNDFLLSSKNLQIHRKCDLIIISILFSDQYKHQQLQMVPVSPQQINKGLGNPFGNSRIRRYQIGYIKLACPVTHVWYLKRLPYRKSFRATPLRNSNSILRCVI